MLVRSMYAAPPMASIICVSRTRAFFTVASSLPLAGGSHLFSADATGAAEPLAPPGVVGGADVWAAATAVKIRTEIHLNIRFIGRSRSTGVYPASTAPPFTLNTSPVMKDAIGVHRNNTGAAI